MAVSKTAIKRSKWKAANPLSSYAQPRSRASPVSMDIERYIDGEFVKLRVYSAPLHRAEQRTLESRIALASFIRQHWDNLTSVCPENISPGHQAVERYIMDQFDVLAIARPVAEIEQGIPPMMLLFFESDEAAMLAMFKFP